MFSLWCIDWVGNLYANRFFYVFLCSVLKVASRPRVKLAGRKSALTPATHPTPLPRWFILLTEWWSRCQSYSLLLCGLFYEAICFKSCLVLFCSCIFQFFFSIAFASLGEERVHLGAFRAFVRFVLVWFCLFPLHLRVWDELRLVDCSLTVLVYLVGYALCLGVFVMLFSVVCCIW